jgi:hypothetical protein
MAVCANCNKRSGTVNWAGEGGALAAVHGLTVKWCKACVLEAQIDYAEKAAERLPRLRAELQKAR